MEISLPVVVALLFVVFLLLLYTNSERNKSLHSSFLATPEAEQDRARQDDSWEGSFSDAENPRSLSVDLEIAYVDGSGLHSNRKISVIKFDNDLHDGIMIAHCQWRNGMRTFRFNRIKECVDSTSGEPISDVSAYLNIMHEKQTRSVEPAD